MSLLALDIGGAHLKAADGAGFALSQSFALWRDPLGLADALRRTLAASPYAQRLFVTMTGELADCFASKALGVAHILEAVQQAAPDAEVGVYLTDGRIVDVSQALAVPMLAAASNWHALARFAVRYCPTDAGALIDIGSTTTDLIPLSHGVVTAQGKNDPERLAARELVYTGVDRTPLFALLPECQWEGRRCTTAPEWFATAADAYLLLGAASAQPDNCDTADQRPRTVEAAHSRVARIICGDQTLVTLEAVQQIAAEFHAAQLDFLSRSLSIVVANSWGNAIPRAFTWIVSGQGEFLAKQLAYAWRGGLDVHVDVVSLAEQAGVEASRCGPAHALAVLASEESA